MKKIFPYVMLALVLLGLLIVFLLYYQHKNDKDDSRDAAVEELKTLMDGKTDSFTLADGSSLDIFSIKHASLAMCAGDKWIYFDPVTSGAEPETDFSQWPKADYILVTHDHYDHYDKQAISQLSKEGTQVIANASVIEDLGYGKALANGESFTGEDGFAVQAVPAYNTSAEKLAFHPEGRDNGYVISLDGMRIYVAGDLEVIPELSEIKDIDIAFLPCNLPYTMSPEQCAEAAGIVRPKVLFPYHYDGTDIPTDLPKLVSLLDGSGIEVRIL